MCVYCVLEGERKGPYMYTHICRSCTSCVCKYMSVCMPYACKTIVCMYGYMFTSLCACMKFYVSISIAYAYCMHACMHARVYVLCIHVHVDLTCVHWYLDTLTFIFKYVYTQIVHHTHIDTAHPPHKDFPSTQPHNRARTHTQPYTRTHARACARTQIMHGEAGPKLGRAQRC